MNHDNFNSFTWGTLALPIHPGSPGLFASSPSSAFLFLALILKAAAASEVAEDVPTTPEVAEVIPAAQELDQIDVLITKALAAIKSLAPSSIYQPKKVKKKLKRR